MENTRSVMTNGIEPHGQTTLSHSPQEMGNSDTIKIMGMSVQWGKKHYILAQ